MIHDFVGISWYVIMEGQIFILLSFFLHFYIWNERRITIPVFTSKKKSFFVQFLQKTAELC